ncbi:MAG: heme o synthase [Rhodovibrionaceae bacterium]|nr:heme o synthase [Rhodovibrionaceae bacterium]
MTDALLVRENASLVREIVLIFKPRIAVAIMLSAVAGVAIAADPLPELWRIGLLALAVFLAAGAAGAFNQWAETDLDARMKRTSGRPFVTGQFRADGRWLAAIVGLLVVSVALAWLAANAWAALYTFLGAFTYGVVYTIWLKRRTWTNIIVGGLAGSFAVLAGAAAVTPALGAEAIILAVVLFLWTPPHFWSLAMLARDDYAKAGVPMLPVVAGDAFCAKVILGHTLALSVLALAPALLGAGYAYLGGAVLGGAIFTWTSLRLLADPSRRNALRNFLASLLQLSLLVSGAILDRAIAVAI